MTAELDIIANDALNPGFGYSLRVLIDGGVAATYDLTEAAARRVMREAVVAAKKEDPR